MHEVIIKLNFKR